MKITLLEPLGVAASITEGIKEQVEALGHTFVSYSDRSEDVEELIKRTGDSDAVIITNLPYPKAVMEKCPNLKYVNVAFTGVDHLDVAYCKERNIAVSNASGYSDIAVAELVFGFMLNLIRNVNACNIVVREEKTKDGLVGTELYQKKMGVIGCGHIGRRVIEIAQVFGCEILAYDTFEDPILVEKGVKFVSIEELMSESDIVTVHVPLMPATVGMISADLIAKMKETAYFINAARGPIVDNAALAEALKAGKIAGAGIDVFEMEPPIPTQHPLLNCPNTLLTPHVAFASKEALVRRAGIICDNMTSWLQGEHKNIIC